MPEYEHLLEGLRSARSKTLEIAQNLTDQEIKTSPEPNKWSVGEILDHLILGMRFYGGEIRHLIELKNAGKESVLKRTYAEFNPSILFIPRSVLASLGAITSFISRLLPDRARQWAMRSRLIPTQNPDVATPRKGRTAAELLQDLESSWNELEKVLHSHPDLNYEEMYHMHPLMGRNNVLMLLRLICLHERRHQDQIYEVLRAGSPARPDRKV